MGVHNLVSYSYCYSTVKVHVGWFCYVKLDCIDCEKDTFYTNFFPPHFLAFILSIQMQSYFLNFETVRQKEFNSRTTCSLFFPPELSSTSRGSPEQVEFSQKSWGWLSCHHLHIESHMQCSLSVSSVIFSRSTCYLLIVRGTVVIFCFAAF